VLSCRTIELCVDRLLFCAAPLVIIPATTRKQTRHAPPRYSAHRFAHAYTLPAPPSLRRFAPPPCLTGAHASALPDLTILLRRRAYLTRIRPRTPLQHGGLPLYAYLPAVLFIPCFMPSHTISPPFHTRIRAAWLPFARHATPAPGGTRRRGFSRRAFGRWRRRRSTGTPRTCKRVPSSTRF